MDFDDFCEAVRRNDIHTCESILAHARLSAGPGPGININQLNEIGYAPLHLAESPEMVTFLLENGANPRQLTSNGNSFLDLVLRPGYYPNQATAIAFLNFVIKNRITAIELSKTKEGFTLSEHCQQLHFDEAFQLLGAARKMIQEYIQEEEAASMTRTIIMVTFKNRGDPKILADALKNAMENIPCFNINEKINGRTFLDYAIETGNAEYCRALINAGCDVNLASNNITPVVRVLQTIESQHTRSSISFGTKNPLNDILSMIINGAPGRQGANLREIYPNIDPPASVLTRIIKAFRFKDLDITRPDIVNQYWPNVKNIILNGHRFSEKRIMDYYGYHLSLEGIQQGITTVEILDSYNEFLKAPDVQAKLNDLMNRSLLTNGVDYGTARSTGEIDFATQISIDIRGIIDPIRQQTVTDNLRHDQVTAIPLLTSVYSPADHAQSCLIDGNYFIHINCGGTRDKRGPRGIVIYEIGDKKAFLEQIPTLLNSSNQPIDDAFLTDELIRKCSLREIRTLKNVPTQTVGNCAWISSEALVRAIIFTNVLKNMKKAVPDVPNIEALCLESAEEISKEWYDLFIGHDRKRGLAQCAAFQKNIPHSVMSDIERKAAEDRKKSDEAHQYWLRMHQGGGSAGFAGSASPSANFKSALEQKLNREARSFIISKQDLASICRDGGFLNMTQDATQALLESFKLPENGKTQIPAYRGAIRELHASAIAPIPEDDERVTIEFEDLNAKKAFLSQFNVGSRLKPIG